MTYRLFLDGDEVSIVASVDGKLLVDMKSKLVVPTTTRRVTQLKRSLQKI